MLRNLIAQHGLLRGIHAAVFGPPKPKALRPTGHSALIESLRIPAIFALSVAMTCGATYVLARSLIVQLTGAVQVNDLKTIIPDVLALFVVVVTGLILDYTFITAATRGQMHTLRGEKGWAVLAYIALFFTGGTETATLAYLFYSLEPTSVGSASIQVVSAIPAILFWIRAAGGALCGVYLVMGVLPLVIQPGDFNRAAAAETGAIGMSLIKRLITVRGIEEPAQLVRIFQTMLAIFEHTTRKRAPNEDLGYRELASFLRELHQIEDGSAKALPAPTHRERVQTYADAYPDEGDDSDFTKTNAVLEAVGVLNGKGGQNNGREINLNNSMHDHLADDSGPSWRNQPASMTGNIATRSVALPLVDKPHIGGRPTVNVHGHAPSKAYVNANNSTARMRKPLRREPARPKIARVMALEPTLSVNQLAKAAGIDLSVASRRHPLRDIETAEMINARRRRLGFAPYDYDPVVEIMDEELPLVDDQDEEEAEDAEAEDEDAEESEDAEETTAEEVVNE